MKRTILILVSALLAHSSVADKTFIIREAGFSISIPDDWKADESRPEIFRAVSADRKAAFKIRISDAEGISTAMSSLDRLLAPEVSNFNGDIDDGLVLGGLRVFTFGGSASAGDAEVEVTGAFVYTNKERFWLLAAFCPFDEFEKYSDILKTIIRSVREI